MDQKSGQLINLLGFDLLDSTLNSITELWDQHISTIKNIVIKDHFIPEVENEVDCDERFSPVPRVPKKSTPTLKKISPLKPRPTPSITVSNTEQNNPDESSPKDNEWSTDDSYESMESIGDETYQRMIGKRASSTSQKLSTVKKKKRKQTEYFTPSIPRKSKRVNRATATKGDNTPKSISRNHLIVKAPSSVIKSSNQMMVSVEKPIGTNISGSSIASSGGTSSAVHQSDSGKGKRAIARAQASRITRATANKAEVTPKIVSPTKSNLLTLASSSVTRCGNKLMSAEKSNGATTSGSSIASSVTTVSSICRTDSIKGKRTVARTATTPDTKSLTASAAKKRLEEEERRKAALMKEMKEKEEKALQTKQEALKLKVHLTKTKNEEKRKKIGEIKKKEEEELREKRQREQSKLEEIEKRRKEKEEARRREMLRNQEVAKKKQIEFDLRKQQEEIERKARLLKQEEQNRLKQEEKEKMRKENEKMLMMIAQHNANFPKGQNMSATQQAVAPPVATVSQFKQPLPPVKSEFQPLLLMNKTFDKEVEIKKETPPPPPSSVPVKVESYQITPPPKPKPAPVNYDISDIKSDDDTDDEEKPKKLIPSWAKGDALIAALDKQFAKSRRARERQIREIFPNFDFSIELSDIFKSSNRIVHPKYDKRTSSAVWSSPPCNTTLNYSMLSDDYQ